MSPSLTPFTMAVFRFASVFLLFASLSHAMNVVRNPRSPVFSDITAWSGVTQVRPAIIKYGGPTVADLDGDGWPDLMFVHHDKTFAEIFWNQKKGKFLKEPVWKLWTDMHGINVCPESVWSKNKLFTISSGGNYGLEPTPPRMFRVVGRKITEITQQAGVNKDGGRGRTTFYMHLKKNNNHKNPDMVVTNAKPNNHAFVSHFAYQNNGPLGGNPPTYTLKRLPNYQFHWNSYAMPADVDGDGQMEIVSYHNLTIYKINAPFVPVDITFQVIPANLPKIGINAIAEFDYNNDGKMDLYLCRTNTADLKWLWQNPFYDILLENQGGKFVDVTSRAGLPRDTQTRGVTVGDFNNDGWMDIFISPFMKKDIMMLGKGDGTFKKVYNLVNRPWNQRGDNAQAVDFDLDGRLDLVVSQGDQFDVNHGGSYRVLRNTGKARKWMLVRVGTAPDRSATSLHAIVTIKAPTGMIMTRRVGSVGDAVSRSMIETVHFGMRGWAKASFVKVTWSSGTSRIMWNVNSRQRLSFGIV